MFYLTLFALTTILFYFAQKSYERSRIMFYVLSYAAILLIAFVAGARDESIGTDVRVYGISTFERAQKAENFGDDVEVFGWIDSGYYAINYLAASLGGGLGAALFLQSLIMTTLVFNGMKTYMATAPLWLTMLLYNLYFYSPTLNMMRQGIAMAILLWSLRFFEARQFKKFLVCAVVCFFFHKTSVLAYLTMFAIYWVAGKDEQAQKKYLLWAAIASATVVALLGAIMAYLATLSSELDRFNAYTSGFFEPSVSTLDVLFRGGAIAAILWLSSKGVVFSSRKYIACLVLIIDLAMQFLGLYSFYATRMSYYFFACAIPMIVSVLSESRLSKGSLTIVKTCLVAFFCYYCIRFYYVDGNNETYPYSSELLGF